MTGGLATGLWGYGATKPETEITASASPSLVHLDETRKMVVKAGGILAIVEAMRTHPKNATVQQVACGALTGLTMLSKSAQKAVAKVCSSACLLCVRVWSISACPCVSVSVVCARVRSLLSHHHKLQAGGTKVVLNAMRSHKGKADVQQECLTTLWQIAFHNIPNQKKIAKFG